jgi:hypothetical protein
MKIMNATDAYKHQMTLEQARSLTLAIIRSWRISADLVSLGIRGSDIVGEYKLPIRGEIRIKVNVGYNGNVFYPTLQVSYDCNLLRGLTEVTKFVDEIRALEEFLGWVLFCTETTPPAKPEPKKVPDEPKKVPDEPISLSLTKTELAIAVALLKDVNEIFSSRGCSDINVGEMFELSEEECNDLHQKMAVWNGDPKEAGSGPIFQNWYLAAYLAYRLRVSS